MDQSTLANFFTTILGFSAIGFLLDQVTLRNRTKEKFETTPFEFKEFLESYFEATHVRFLGENFFSLKFWMTGFLLYLVSMTVWILFIIGPSWEALSSFLELNSIALIVVYLGGFIAFILNLYQTQIFVKGAARSDQIAPRAVFVGTDLLVSSNIFIFIFSTFVMLGITLAWSIENGEFRKTPPNQTIVQYSVRPVSAQNVLGIFHSTVFEHNLTVQTLPADAVSNASGETSFRIVATKPSIPILPFFTLYARSDRPISIQFPEQDVNSKSTELDNVIEKYIQAEGIEKDGLSLRLVGEAKIVNRPSFQLMYTASFQEVDRIEDNFMSLFDHDLKFISPLKVLFLQGGFSPFFDEPICTFGGRIVTKIYEQPKIKKLINCMGNAEIINGYREAPRAMLAPNRVDALAKPILLSPVYLAVMTPSILFYFVLTALLVSQISWRLFAKSEHGRSVIRTVPFSIAFLIIGVAIWFFFVT